MVQFNLPRVGIYRVDIEQRNSISRGEALKDLTKSPSKTDSEHTSNCTEEAGKVAAKLRQVVEKARWEPIAGSPKFINAKFSVSAYRKEKEVLAIQEEMNNQARTVFSIASHFGGHDLTSLSNLPGRAALRDTEHERFEL